MTDDTIEVFPDEDAIHVGDPMNELEDQMNGYEPAPAATSPSNRQFREAMDKLKRDAARSTRRAAGLAIMIVLFVGGLAWLVSFTFLRSSIENQLRSSEVVDRLEKVKTDTENTNREIRILLEDTDAKIQQAIAKLSEGNVQYQKTAETLIGELQANAMAAKRGFQLQIGKHFWTTGQEPVKMLHMSEGVCFLFYVSGQFDGVSDAVAVDLHPDGHWYLNGHTSHPVRAGAISLKIIPVIGDTPADTAPEG